MDDPVLNGGGANPAGYDYRLYDRIWQRVSPDLDPYPETRAQSGSAQGAGSPAGTGESAPPQGGGLSAPRQENGSVDDLPGADMDPCCMGSAAQESLEVLEGFIEEELSERRCCLALASRVQRQDARRLLRRFAQEKCQAARRLSTAYYLITGRRYTVAITVEHMQWGTLAQALRACYHQQACNGLNYQRAADETLDPCLQKMLGELSQLSYRQAEDTMAFLSGLVC